MKKHILYVGFFIVLLLSYWSILPLLAPGFFPMHDDTQVARVDQMAKALTDGMFPVRWVPDLGYGFGYPIFTFYAPLSYYIGAAMMLTGLDALLATKLMIALGILLSGITMYFLARVTWGKTGAVVSALLYVYAPYHAVNVYVRGAIGEVYGYAWIPLIFYALLKVYVKKQFRYIVIGGMAYAALLLSHNLTAMMVTPFIIATTLLLAILSLKNGSRKAFYFLQCIIFLGLLLSAFYWVPALLEMRYTNVISQVGGAADFREHYVCLSQFWDSPWGFGGSAKGCIDGISYKIGKLHIVFAFLSLLVLPILWKMHERKRFFLLSLAFVFLVISLFLALDISRSIWKGFPPLAFVQYPWRFLTLIVFFTSFASGAVFWIISEKVVFLKKNPFAQIFFGLVIGVVIVLVNGKLFTPQTIFDKKSQDYTQKETIRFATSKISDEYMPQSFQKPRTQHEVPMNKFYVLSGNAEIQVVEEKSQLIKARIFAKTETELFVSIAYFPAWQARLNGQRYDYTIEKNGLLLATPKGRYDVELRYVSTNIERIANLVSLIGVSLLIIGIIVARRKKVL